MAWHPRAIHRPLSQNAWQDRITPIAIAQHTAVSSSDSLHGYFSSDAADGVESHFYVRFSGVFEQYIDSETMAHCQRDGNRYAISIETEDNYPTGWEDGSDVPAFSDAQLESLADIYAWCHLTHGIPLVISKRWDGPGVGWHRKYIGNPGWARSYRACPGDRRIAAIPTIIDMADDIIDGEEPTMGEITRAQLGKMLDTRFDALEARLLDRTTARYTEEQAKRWSYSQLRYSIARLIADASLKARAGLVEQRALTAELRARLDVITEAVLDPMTEQDRSELADTITARTRAEEVKLEPGTRALLAAEAEPDDLVGHEHGGEA